MHPVLRRILLHGGLTAVVLALVGMVFAEMAGIWLAGNAARSGAAADPVPDSLRTRVPLMMAAWGFVFVLMCELVVWRVRGTKPPPAPEPPDDAEALLNELLAQAEAAHAAAGSGQWEVGSGQGTKDGGQRAEDGGDGTEGMENKQPEAAGP